LLELVEFFRNKPKEFWWKGLSYLVSTFVLVPNIAMLLFLVYMAEYNFFSYDFFLEGVFGMKWFFITTIIFLVVTASVFYSPMIFLFLYKKRNVVVWPLWIIYGILSVVFWGYAGNLVFSGSSPERVIFLVAICFVISVHLVTLTCYDAKTQFFSMGSLIVVIVFSSFNYSRQVAEIVSIGLKSFGVGGDLSVVVKDDKSGAESSGKLKLITPQNIYMIADDSNNLSVYSLNHVASYTIKIEGKK